MYLSWSWVDFIAYTGTYDLLRFYGLIKVNKFPRVDNEINYKIYVPKIPNNNVCVYIVPIIIKYVTNILSVSIL